MSKAVQILNHVELPRTAGVYYRLTCLTGEAKGTAYYLIGKRAVMGRSENCDITILDLKSSREHAEIILVGKEYILTDLGSQNGIIINDLKVKQHALVEGDKVIVGKTVYKFSKIEVKGEGTKTKKTRKKRKVEDVAEEEPKNSKMTIGLSLLIILAVLLLFEDEMVEEDTKKKKPVLVGNVKEVSDSFAQAIKDKSENSKKNKEKLELYFKRGLREYREGNFYRAILEFENAKQWSPKDRLASFYLRKTRESLDEQIQSYFSKAIRDIDSINYEKASVSYCTIIKILVNEESDPRYIAAKGAISNLEKKMGLDEGQIVCIESKDDK